jgi:hypothetical protein
MVEGGRWMIEGTWCKVKGKRRREEGSYHLISACRGVARRAKAGLLSSDFYRLFSVL